MFDLTKFDEYREDNRREVKKAKGGLPQSLWETYSSFSNCNGGIIILGVQELHNGTWIPTGLENEAKLRKEFWDTINNPMKVSKNILTDRDVQTCVVEGNVIMTIHVPPASREQKPIYINNDLYKGTFRRNWEGDYHCTQSEIRAMLRDQPEQSIDMKILDDWTIHDLNQESIQAYRNMHKILKPGHVWGMLENETYLRNIGAAAVSKNDKKLHPTVAGMLMFGNEYTIVREFPEYFLDYREMLDSYVRWTDRIHSSSGEWSGNIFDFYFRVYNKIIRNIKVPFKTQSGERIDDTPVHQALREALANCLINADFFVPRGVVIKNEEDSITFENPGYIRTGKKQMRLGGESDPRNKGLMKMFNLINIGERAGSGVPSIFHTWNKEGWEEPVIEERFGEASRTILILSFKKKQAKKTSEKNKRKKQAKKASEISKRIHTSNTKKTMENKNKIMDHIRQNHSTKTKLMAEIIGLSEARTRVILNELVEEGILETSGSTKSKIYILKKTTHS